MLLGNMANAIMEGASFGTYTANIDNSKYSHEEGAAIIAMESADALADIYTTLNYENGKCTIKAILIEGASCVEESSQAAIMEGVIGNAFTKIKEFLAKLKEKVKEFFHNVKRYLTGLFGDADKWVSQYESELEALKSEDLKGYKVRMYNYTIGEFDAVSKIKQTHGVDKAKVLISTLQTQIDNKTKDVKTWADGNITMKWKDWEQEEAAKSLEVYEEALNTQLEETAKKLCGSSVDDIEDFQKEMWSNCRDGATGESSKEDVEVSGKIKTFISAIKAGKKTISSMQSSMNAIDTGYSTMIKFIEKVGDTYDKGVDDNKVSKQAVIGGNSNSKEMHTTTAVGAKYAVEACRLLSSHQSKLQSYENSYINVKKQATTEMIGAYKSALLGAFGYARKNKAK